MTERFERSLARLLAKLHDVADNFSAIAKYDRQVRERAIAHIDRRDKAGRCSETRKTNPSPNIAAKPKRRRKERGQ